MITIWDTEGNELARAVATFQPGSDRLQLSRVLSGKGNLLHYYFVKSMRTVVFGAGERRACGSLETHWAGNCRSWAIRIAPSPVRRSPGRELTLAR